MRSIVPVIAALGAILICNPSEAKAQRPAGSGPSRGPGWLRRQGRFELAPYKITPAELGTAIHVLTVIEDAFFKIPELAHPDGFEVAPSMGGFGPNESLLHYGYDVMFFVPTQKIAGEGSACIRVLVNNGPGPGVNGMEGYRDDRGSFFFEDPRGDPIPGATHVWNHISPTERSSLAVMFATGNRSPLEPVSGERFQRAKVAFFERFRSSVQRETPYDRWMAEAPRRKADREGMRTTLPSAEAATVIKNLEDAEREGTARLKAADPADRAENARLLGIYTGMVERAQARLATLTAAERAAEAWVERRAEPPPGAYTSAGDLMPLVSSSTPLAARVLVPRPEVYQGHRLRVAPRVIQVLLSASLTCQYPAIQRAIYQAQSQLDWAAVERLVNPQ